MIWLVNCWTVSRWVFVIKSFWEVPVNALIRTYFILWKLFPCERNHIKLDSKLDIYIKGLSSRVWVDVYHQTVCTVCFDGMLRLLCGKGRSLSPRAKVRSRLLEYFYIIEQNIKKAGFLKTRTLTRTLQN